MNATPKTTEVADLKAAYETAADAVEAGGVHASRESLHAADEARNAYLNANNALGVAIYRAEMARIHSSKGVMA
jgi:hypothetical protein